MTQTATQRNHTLAVAGATLHYEVRGSGPLLLVIGSPMAAAEFAPVADALATDHTVVTYDPRGFGASQLDDPDQPASAELRADDVAAILDDLGAESADMFGSSGGAVTGLALVTKYPNRVRTLVAHEPPLLDDDQGAPIPAEPTDQELREAARFFDHDLRASTQYRPDVAALTAGPARVVVGIGADSGALLTYRTSAALCALMGSEPVEFPGDHGGFMGVPVEFADHLNRVLAGSAG